MKKIWAFLRNKIGACPGNFWEHTWSYTTHKNRRCKFCDRKEVCNYIQITSGEYLEEWVSQEVAK